MSVDSAQKALTTGGELPSTTLTPVAQLDLPEPASGQVSGSNRTKGLFSALLRMRHKIPRTPAGQVPAVPWMQLWGRVFLTVFVGFVGYGTISNLKSGEMELFDLSNKFHLSIEHAYLWLTAVAVMVIALAASAPLIGEQPESGKTQDFERTRLIRLTSNTGAMMTASLSVTVSIAGIVGILGSEKGASSVDEAIALGLLGFVLSFTASGLSLTLGEVPRSQRESQPALDDGRAKEVAVLLNQLPDRGKLDLLGWVVWSGLSAFVQAMMLIGIANPRFIFSFDLPWSSLASFAWYFFCSNFIFSAIWYWIVFAVIRGFLSRYGLRWYALAAFSILVLLLLIAAMFTYNWLTIVFLLVLPNIAALVSLLPWIGNLCWGRSILIWNIRRLFDMDKARGVSHLDQLRRRRTMGMRAPDRLRQELALNRSSIIARPPAYLQRGAVPRSNYHRRVRTAPHH